MDMDRRRAGGGSGEGPTGVRPFRLGAWVVDPAANRIRQAEVEVRLEPKVMRVLMLLAERHGEVVSRRDVEARVWPQMLVTDDSVTNSLIKLRKALGDDARNPVYIETIAKSGYRLIAEVVPLEEAEGAVPPASISGQLGGTVDESPVTTERASSRSWRMAVIPILAALLAFGWLVTRQVQMELTENQAEFAEQHSVAVLPFENLTRDPEHNYFTHGITEDLITDLSKLSSLRVVARNSSMAYRNSTETDHQIGLELGVRYIVRGSVQRSGQRLRINVRLTDAREDLNRWAERYDRELSDIFRVQDEITARVVSALEIELAPGEQQRLTRKYVTSVEAYDEFLRGLDLLGRRSGEDNDEAKSHFEQAIALEPRFARAYAGLAQAYSQDAVYDRGPKAAQSVARAEVLARKGLEFDDSLPQLRFVISMVEMFKGNLESATAEVLHAIELKPSYADGYGLLARIMHFAGRPEEGLEAITQANRLNPRVPALYRMVHGSLLYQLGRNDEALRELKASVDVSPNLLLSRLYLAAAYAASNQLGEARWEIDEILSFNPHFTVSYLDYGFPIRDQALRQRFVADLLRAGLPDE
jgi:TolB-like protein/DNA-binding winged helix-turn-helix (wHTH) protein/Tfp pilus assembly protein PilF